MKPGGAKKRGKYQEVERSATQKVSGRPLRLLTEGEVAEVEAAMEMIVARRSGLPIPEPMFRRSIV